jgi:hypothetical protein
VPSSSFTSSCARPTAAPPRPLHAWRARIVEALSLPEALVDHLENDLAMPCHGSPAAEFGVWVTTTGSVTDLVDVTGHQAIPGTTASQWFAGYAIADPAGAPASTAARELIRQLCDYTLHLDDYESALGVSDG